MVEAFDMWAKKKNKFDYFSDFEEWHKRAHGQSSDAEPSDTSEKAS